VTTVDRLQSVGSINVGMSFCVDRCFLRSFCKKTLRGVTAIAGQSATSPRRLSFLALTNFLRHSSIAKISVPTCTAIAFTRCTAPRPSRLHPDSLLRALQDNWQEREAAIAWSRCFPASLPRLPIQSYRHGAHRYRCRRAFAEAGPPPAASHCPRNPSPSVTYNTRCPTHHPGGVQQGHRHPA
jgi:hypothetical protein